MTAKDLINYLIPPLKVSDDLEKVSRWMEEFKLVQLPVINQNQFLGMVTEEIMLENSSDTNHLEDLIHLFPQPKIHQDTHYFDVLKRAYEMESKLIAVVDDDDTYLGVISIEDVVEAFANSSSVNIPGAILVLSMEFRDYSLTEISRIIESEDAKILSTNLITDPDNPSNIRLTLKINREEVGHLTKILASKGYSLVDTYTRSEEINPDLDRYDALMKYLKM